MVEHSNVTTFLERLNKTIEQFYKDDNAPERMLGEAINDFHHNRICALLKDHKGTVIVGNAQAHIDKKLEPTVILNPAMDSPLMKEEIFGPILPVLTYNSFDEAVKIIKSIEKPLVIYYFGPTKSKNYQRLEAETSSGSLVTNDYGIQVACSELPFGGVGHSGYGRWHGY